MKELPSAGVHTTVGGALFAGQILDTIERGSADSPFGEALSVGWHNAQNAWHVATGQEGKVREHWMEDLIEGIGYATGLGTGQLGKSAEYIKEVGTGHARADTVDEVISGIMFGPPPKKGTHK